VNRVEELRMKLRTRISLYLILFGMIPLLIAFAINVPMIFDRIEILYHKAHLQNLRAEFSDLDQHLARRHEMARLLAKMPEPGMLQLPDALKSDEELGVARAGYVGWANQILIDQLDVTQVLFLDENGKPVFWMDRNSVTSQLEINTAQHRGVNPRLHEASKTLRPGVVLNGPIIFDREAGAETPSRFMQLSLVSPVVIPMMSSGSGELSEQRGTVIVYLDLGGLANAYRGNYWVLGDGQYLASASGEVRQNSAFEDFQGLQSVFSKGELDLWKFGDQQVLWVPLFETEDAGTLWVGRSVDASPLAKLQRVVELRIVFVAIGLLIVVFIVARLIAIKTERLGHELTDRITRVLEQSEEVIFSWEQPQELNELGKTLTQLSATHAGNTRALHDYAEELEASNRYKSEFLANVSHELRTPLNSILLLSKMLAENPTDALSPEQARQAKVIHDAGSDLRALIDNILDLSRIEARQMALATEPVNLRTLIDSVVELMKPQLDEKSLELKLEIDPAAPQSIISDGEKLRQILINFLSNAVKFTERGGITVSLRYGAGSPGDPCPVSISVTDTGVGIEQDKHGLVFEAFKQADGSTSRRFGGTGLGLSISRELAGLMGGKIDVQSQAGAGSTFTLLLPLEMPTEQAEVGDSNTVSGRVDKMKKAAIPVADYGAARVLLVDDDVRNLLALTPLLEQWHLQVMAAGDGPEALETLESDGEFNLVFMDIMMPGMDGYEAIRRIRQQDRFSELPIIALTARAGEEDLRLCRESGADDCVVKPVDPAELKKLLDNYLAGADGAEEQ
jgi:signal transduction histidine kinase/CheY-like chemotaxis protein